MNNVLGQPRCCYLIYINKLWSAGVWAGYGWFVWTAAPLWRDWAAAMPWGWTLGWEVSATGRAKFGAVQELDADSSARLGKPVVPLSSCCCHMWAYGSPDLEKLKQCAHGNLMRFNKTKCKVLHLGWDSPWYQHRLAMARLRVASSLEMFKARLDGALSNLF